MMVASAGLEPSLAALEVHDPIVSPSFYNTVSSLQLYLREDISIVLQ
jgi:hypothetical protein